MTYDQIRRMPTSVDRNHESLTRAYHILGKVKDLLREDTAGYVIQELINMMETDIPAEAPVRNADEPQQSPKPTQEEVKDKPAMWKPLGSSPYDLSGLKRDRIVAGLL